MATRRAGAHAHPRRRVPLIVAAGVLAVIAAGTIVAIATSAGVTPPAAGVGSSQSPTTSPGSSASPDAGNEPGPSEPGTESPSVPATPPASPPIPMSEPIGLDESAEPVAGLVSQVRKLEAVEGQASAKGEVAGPALRFELTLTNNTAVSIPLDTAVVTVEYGAAHTPAGDLAEPGGKPLPDSVGAGKSVTGVYVFTVPPEAREQVRVLLDYSVDVPIVVFEGAAPR